MSNDVISARLGGRTRPITVGTTALNLFATSLVAPIVPYIIFNRPVGAFVFYNRDTAETMYIGYDNTVTNDAGANRGIPVGPEQSLSRQVTADILKNGIWVIAGAVALKATLEELI